MVSFPPVSPPRPYKIVPPNFAKLLTTNVAPLCFVPLSAVRRVKTVNPIIATSRQLFVILSTRCLHQGGKSLFPSSISRKCPSIRHESCGRSKQQKQHRASWLQGIWIITWKLGSNTQQRRCQELHRGRGLVTMGKGMGVRWGERNSSPKISNTGRSSGRSCERVKRSIVFRCLCKIANSNY